MLLGDEMLHCSLTDNFM